MNEYIDTEKNEVSLIDAAKKKEAEYYDKISEIRVRNDHVPLEADIRTDTLFIPNKGQIGIVIDAKMREILDHNVLKLLIEELNKKGKCRVLDVCSGLGWLSLELAREGHVVEAYDLSKKSVNYAEEIRRENETRPNFGEINYHNADVTKVLHGKEEFDAIIGWSAFHHLDGLNDFLDLCKSSLKKDGLIVTYDDFARGKLEAVFELGLRFLLPQYNHTYTDKIKYLNSLKSLHAKVTMDTDSPMEKQTSKSSSVEMIDEYFYGNFEVMKYITRNSFCGTALMNMQKIKGRYVIARIFDSIDAALIKIGLLKGFDRIIFAKNSRIGE